MIISSKIFWTLLRKLHENVLHFRVNKTKKVFILIGCAMNEEMTIWWMLAGSCPMTKYLETSWQLQDIWQATIKGLLKTARWLPDDYLKTLRWVQDKAHMSRRNIWINFEAPQQYIVISNLGENAAIWCNFQNIWQSRFWGHWGQRTFNVEFWSYDLEILQ